MCRTAVLSAGLGVFLVLATSLPAAAYVDVGYDPDDQPDGTYDIRSTSRRVEPAKHGRYLKVVVRIDDEDARSISSTTPGASTSESMPEVDEPRDAILHLWSEDLSGSGCDVTTRSGRLLRHGSLGTGATFARCRVPVHPLHPSKRIRWRVAMSDSGGSVVDLAPDVGMYS